MPTNLRKQFRITQFLIAISSFWGDLFMAKYALDMKTIRKESKRLG